MRDRTIIDVLSDSYDKKYAREYEEKLKNINALIDGEEKEELAEISKRMAESIAEGIAEGMAKGIPAELLEEMAQGRAEEKIAATQRLLEQGFPFDLIQKATLLSITSIRNIAKSMKISSTSKKPV